MNIRFSPQRSDNTISYEISNEVIRVAIDGKTDVFDFSDIPDGKMEEIETILSVNPIVSAKRVDGSLFIELLNYIGKNASEEERFPQWQVIN